MESCHLEILPFSLSSSVSAFSRENSTFFIGLDGTGFIFDFSDEAKNLVRRLGAVIHQIIVRRPFNK